MKSKSPIISKCLIVLLITILSATVISHADEAAPQYPIDSNEEEPTTCEHEWIEEDREESTCTKKGYIGFRCQKCNDTRIQSLPLAKHDWEEDYRVRSTCKKKGKIVYYCWECGKTKTKKLSSYGKHRWTSYKTTRKATVFKKGIKKSHCKVCKKTRKKSIAKRKAFIKINKKSLKLKIKKSRKLTVKFAYGDKIKSWKSSNSKVASVTNKGNVTAKSSGKATITVILKSGKKAKCKITVPKVKKPAPKKSSGGGKVYWVPNGSVWHVSRSCPTLSRSKTVYSGTIAQSGKPRCCKVCG